MEAVAAPEVPTQTEEISDSDEERDEDDLDDCDLISSEDSGSDDSSDDDDEDEEGKSRRPDLFPDPLSLIDHAADLNSVLKAKSIGDAIQILCPNLPGLPSKARGKYQKRKLLSEEQKAKILRARNRDNARRTRKRKKLYVNFIDKALKALETALGVSSTSTASQSTKLEEDGRSDNELEESCQDSDDRMQEQISRASGKVDGHSDGDFSRHQKNSLTTFGLDSDPRSSSSSPTLHSSVYLKDSTQSSSRAVAPSSENDTPSQISDSTEKEQDNQNTSSSEGIRRKLRIPVPHYPMDSSATTCNLLAKRVRYMRAYLKLRHSPLPDASESGNASPSKVAEWLTVCAAEVVHVTPLLAYRQEKDIQQMSCCPRDCMYECRGVDAVAMDCQRIAEYFDSLRGTSSNGEATSPHDRNNFNRSGSKSAKSRPQRQWLASFEMNSDSATLCDNGSTLLLCYKLTVQAVDQPAPSVVKLERELPEVFSLASSKMPNTQPILPQGATASATLPATVGNSTTPSFDRQLKSANSTSSSSRSPVMPQGQGIDQLRQMDCGAEDDPESDSQEDNDDDDICKWLEMALDTTYIHDPRYEKRRAGSIGRDFSEQESSRLSHTGTAASTSAPPLEECESDSEGAVSSPTEDRSAKRSKSSSSNNDIDVSGAAETEALPPVCGTVLFQLCIQARVEFGCCGCDSDGRILRVTEHY